MSEQLRVKTFHGTDVFVNGKNQISHKFVGRGVEAPLHAERVDGGVHLFADRGGARLYVVGVKPDLTLEMTTEPAMITSINNADGSLTLKVGRGYLSARTEGNFALAPKNRAWEHLTLEAPSVREKRRAVLLMMNNKELESVLSSFDLDKIHFEAILMERAGDTVVTINGEKVPLLSLQLIDRVLKYKECLWLLGGMTLAGGHDMYKMSKFLREEGVPRENIINCTILQNITRWWYGNLHYVQKHPIDFFATGISYSEFGLDLNCIKGAVGVNFSNSSQDLRQGYMTARHIFEHRPSTPPPHDNFIKFVLIGLAPYSFRYDVQKSFAIQPRNLHYLLALKGMEPETEYDKLLLDLISNKVRRLFTTSSEKDADLNFMKKKYAANRDFTSRSMFNYQDLIDNRNKKFYHETVDQNIKILEDYIKLCLEHGAKPIGLLFPHAPIIRRNYSQDVLNHFRQTIYLLERAYDFSMIDLFDLPLEYDCFCDMVHMNLKGAAAASTVLNERLHELKILPLTSVGSAEQVDKA